MARRPKSAQAMAIRARIVLSCGEGMSNSEVARKLRITGATVAKWRERFRKDGMDVTIALAAVKQWRNRILYHSDSW